MFKNDEIDLLYVQRFAEAAQQGKRAGGKASSGEAAALRLARKVSRISAEMQNVDRVLQEGFCVALVMAAFPDSRGTVLKLLPH